MQHHAEGGRSTGTFQISHILCRVLISSSECFSVRCGAEGGYVGLGGEVELRGDAFVRGTLQLSGTFFWWFSLTEFHLFLFLLYSFLFSFLPSSLFFTSSVSLSSISPTYSMFLLYQFYFSLFPALSPALRSPLSLHPVIPLLSCYVLC